MKPAAAPREHMFKSEADAYLWFVFEALTERPDKVPEVMAGLGVCDSAVVELVQRCPEVLIENFGAILGCMKGSDYDGSK